MRRVFTIFLVAVWISRAGVSPAESNAQVVQGIMGLLGSAINEAQRQQHFQNIVPNGNTSAAADPKAMRRLIQIWLILGGYYPGPLDGEFGASSTVAFKKLQKDLGHRQTGVLSQTELYSLQRRATRKGNELGLQNIVDPHTGVGIVLPSAIVKRRIAGPVGTDFTSTDGAVVYGLRHIRTTTSLNTIYENLKAAANNTSIEFTTFRGDWFVLAGQGASKKYYIRYHARGGYIAGFFIVYNPVLDNEFWIPLTLSSLTVEPFAGTPDNAILNLRTEGLLAEPIEAVNSRNSSAAQQKATPSVATPVNVQPADQRKALFAKINAGREFIEAHKETIRHKKLQQKAVEVLSRLVEQKEDADEKALQDSLSDADAIIAELKSEEEFERVSKVAADRVDQIKKLMTAIVSDAVYVSDIKSALEKVELARGSGSLRELQNALASLNMTIDQNRNNLQRDKFESP